MHDALLNIENINRVINILNIVDKRLYNKLSEISRHCGIVAPMRLVYDRYNIITMDTVRIESPSTVKLVSLYTRYMILNDGVLNVGKVYFPYDYLTMECKDIENALYDDEYSSLLKRIELLINKSKGSGKTNFIMDMSILYKLLELNR